MRIGAAPAKPTSARGVTASADACRRKFLRFFPRGFRDETYLAWERNYKAEASQRWQAVLASSQFAALLQARQYHAIVAHALRIEARTNLLFSFEKMALRDAVRSASGARVMATGLFDWLHGEGSARTRFERWCDTVERLPRRQTRVLTWPVVTVFGFIAAPRRHIFLKPNVTRIASARYRFDLQYEPRPSWNTYRRLLELARMVKKDTRDLGVRDLIDVQSFLWVQGSEEYRGRSFRAAFTTTATMTLSGL